MHPLFAPFRRKTDNWRHFFSGWTGRRLPRWIIILSCLAALQGLPPPVSAQSFPVPSGSEPDLSPRGLLDRIRITAPVDFCGEPVPLERPEVAERLELELLLMVWNQPQTILWLKRANRYMPEIEAALRSDGLPLDLKSLPVIESALRPHAGSSAGAIGYWQFVRSTAQRYDLTVDNRKDERRSLAASTRAAMRYLKDLHDQFGSWHLAAAAYNMGESGLAAEMLAQETQDYYRLYLPLETQRYVIRAVAVKLIFTDPQRFGYHLESADLYPPLMVDSVTVNLKREIPIQLLARATNSDFKTIKDLNPDLRGHYLAAGRHELRIPAGHSDDLDTRLALLAKDLQGQREERIYLVRPGDNLSLIAERFGVPLQALRIWNRLDLRKPIHPGDRLVVRPPKEALPPDSNDEN